MPASVTKDVIFIHVPKTGGTSIGDWLGGLQFDGHPTLDMLSKYHDGQLTFGVVRNPWDRAVSGWNYLFKTPHIDTNFQSYIDKTPAPTFEEFLYQLDTVKTEQFWFDGTTPQVAWLDPVDIVLSFHNLQNDFRHIQYALNDFRPLPRLNASIPHINYRSYYTPETRALVSEIFEQDIRAFGFTF